MGKKMSEDDTPPVQLLSKAIERFFSVLKENPKAYVATEIAFITFGSDIEMNTEFKTLRTLEIPEFQALKTEGTNISFAVLEAIKKIDERRAKLKCVGIKCYTPFLVIVTDGDPNQSDHKSPTYAAALEAIEAHCHDHTPINELILPFVIGVGSRVDTELLNMYAQYFLDSYLPFKKAEDDMGKRLAGVFDVMIRVIMAAWPVGEPRMAIDVMRKEANQWLKEIEELTKLSEATDEIESK
jgi:uncharacterized protein YegL